MFHKNIELGQEAGCSRQAEGQGPRASVRAGSSGDLSTVAEQARLLRKVQKARSRRHDFLNPRLFGEPAWDMLLELFACTVEQRRITVGEMCRAANVPQTTALRWIDVLLKEALVTRRSDPLDARRVHLELTPSAYSAMRDYAEQLSASLRGV
jgi:DNA-binding MarR family transcriptional regulator